jgi:biopolymer transport protein ExbB/TolQ
VTVDAFLQTQILFEIFHGSACICVVREFLQSRLLSHDLSVLVLIILSIALLSCFVERYLFLNGARVKPQQFIDGVLTLLRRNRHNEALTVCESSPGVVAMVVKVMLMFENGTADEMVRAASGVASLEIPLLERRLNTVRLIAKIAPLVSFVGVLYALAKILHGAEYQSAYFSSQVAVSFVEHALILIAFGLTINVAGSVAYAILHGLVKSLIYDMEWSCSEIVNYVSATQGNHADSKI